MKRPVKVGSHMQGTAQTQDNPASMERAAQTGAFPKSFDSVEQLDAFLSQPSPDLIDDLSSVDGDILILGVAGKMGPTLARLARNAAPDKRIVGVARFSEAGQRDTLEQCGIETIKADLLDQEQVEALPRMKTSSSWPA